MNKDGHNIDSVSLLVLYFRAEKHLSWSKDMVKQWEIAVEDHLSREYTSRNLEIFVFSPSIVERGRKHLLVRFWYSNEIISYDFTSFKETLSGGIEENSGNYLIESFLRWPEFSFWEGFMKLRNGTGGQLHVDKFFFTTGFHGEKLHSWNERGRLLKAWRSEADRYTEEFNVTVFSDDAFYLDLLEVIPSITSQSMLATFICMVIICALFISDFSTISVVSISILTTCLGAARSTIRPWLSGFSIITWCSIISRWSRRVVRVVQLVLVLRHLHLSHLVQDFLQDQVGLEVHQVLQLRGPV
uniref:SSD domain-containing protein n=1 Tax=Heterorhabditis bacteriophora TaxID=37862 RepID=A0A1I7WBP3_HETBA